MCEALSTCEPTCVRDLPPWEEHPLIGRQKDVKVKPVEYQAVIRYLFLNGAEMKATYGEDTPSYDVKHWHRQLRCGHGSYPRVIHLMTVSIKWRLPIWKIAILLFAS